MALYLGNQKVLPIIDIQVQCKDSGGQYLVRVIDYDGTVLKQDHLDEGATFEMPENPSHTGLVFDGWSSPVTINNGVVTVSDSDITIGAMYHTISGLSEFDISGTLTVTLNMNGTKNWGDGTSDTSTTHTYASAGDYTITCNGTTMSTSSGGGLFGQNSSVINYYVKGVRLGSNITSIGNNAFYYCYSLTNITIPSSVTSIGITTFYYCYSLTSITIPEGVTSIGSFVFSDCPSLTSITIPSTATSIGSSAFQNCYSLTSITIPSSVTSIGSSAFQNCYSLTSISIPSSGTNIGNSAFRNCCSLTSVILPSSGTSIGNNVFYGCSSLTSITIPSSVTSIGSSAFYGCSSFTSITIPSSVTSIGSGAFYGCSSILEYDFSNHTAIPTLSNTNAFNGINKICKIKVPASLESQWKVKTNWSTYANYIKRV